MGKYGILALFVFLCTNALAMGEKELRLKNVWIQNSESLCSSVQIVAPSGKQYLLSAGHCAKSDEPGVKTLVNLPNGLEQVGYSKIIAEDPYSDLLLLEPVKNMEGIKIAKEVVLYEHVRTFTHGGGKPTYKTEGEIISIRGDFAEVPIFEIITIADTERCYAFKAKYKFSIDKKEYWCHSISQTAITTAWAIPGSSGGMVVNDDDELIGIISEVDVAKSKFSYPVPLADIQAFLKDK